MKVQPEAGARSSSLAFLVTSALAAAALTSAGGEPAPEAPKGPFTAAQSARGKAVYASGCAACHGAALTGGSAPPLTGKPFEASWSHPQVTLDDLLFILRTTMPPRASGSVSPEDHLAVCAYILETNGYKAGESAAKAGAPELMKPPRWVAAASAALPGGAAGVAPPTAPPEFVAGDADAKPGSGGPDQAALSAAATSTDWLHYTHDYAGTRFSPLSEIDATNAHRLTPACVFQLGEPDNFQTGPLVHAGTMYLTTWRSTFALDAATCRPKWKYSWEPRAGQGWERNRGLALKDGRLVRGTPDGYLIALSAETGALLWARRVAQAEKSETFTMAPLVYDDLVLIGPAGSEANVQGWVGAFRLKDGSPVWRFNTVPRPGEAGHETWKNPKGIPMGGGALWTSFSLDPETGDLHVPVTNPAPDRPCISAKATTSTPTRSYVSTCAPGSGAGTVSWSPTTRTIGT